MNITEILEISGENYVGKSDYVLSLLNKKDYIVYIDTDFKLNKNKIKESFDNLYICMDNNIDTIYEIAKNSYMFDTIIIDSLPNIQDNNNLNDLNYDYTIFDKLKTIIKLCKQNNCKLIIINQLRYVFDNNKCNNKKRSFGLKKLGLYYTKRISIDNNHNIKIIKNLHK